jgi:WD40 repeat protein
MDTLKTFSPDGKVLVLEVEGRAIRLMDPASGKELARLEDPKQERSHWAGFTPDGTRLVTLDQGGLARSIRVWDLRRLRQELAARRLDWDAPEYPPAPPPLQTRLRVELVP